MTVFRLDSDDSLGIVVRYVLCLVSLELWGAPLPQVSVMLPFLRVMRLTLEVQVRWYEIWAISVYYDSTPCPKSRRFPRC